MTKTSQHYVSRNAPNLKVKLPSGVVRFENKTLALEDAQQIKELEELIANNPAVARYVEKLDRSVAEEIAKAHLAASKMPSAAKGTFAVSQQRQKVQNPGQGDIGPSEAEALKEVGMTAAVKVEKK